MSWFLDEISIEGFRGINNQGDPLSLKLNPNNVNSVSAPNGVGKSSIFEAVTYAVTGKIPKLDNLPAAERGESYYLNRFHPSNIGTIALTLSPDNGGNNTVITVTRDDNGVRHVATNDGSDGEATLAILNREFVLLDSATFRSFIDDKPLDRGRSFSGLLGLGIYSMLRQYLKSLDNTRKFNNHFDLNAKKGKIGLIDAQIVQARATIQASYLGLVGEQLGADLTNDELREKARSIVLNIALLHSKCEGKAFDEISADECVAAVRDAEGGPDRERLAKLLQDENRNTALIGALPSKELIDHLTQLGRERDVALKETRGDAFLRLYQLAEGILEDESWQDKRVCPTCERSGEGSVLDHSKAQIARYKTVTDISDQIRNIAANIDWGQLTALEEATKREGDVPAVQEIGAKLSGGDYREADLVQFQAIVFGLRERADQLNAAIAAEKVEIEARLPPSLVALTTRIEAMRQLQSALKSEEGAWVIHEALVDEVARIERLKGFLGTASGIFSAAEADASARRLGAVQPLCRQFFESIVYEQVVPAISKPAGSENLEISLADFFDLQDVSAPSLLSESYRNAFAISVYLAAAALYGGPARFLLLDDVTSSMDAGHQFHLMEVIRTAFSRPGNPNGPQVILFSHDTLLEKYFNTQGSTRAWLHQRIEGTPRTAVLPQSNAVNRVYDATMALLASGNALDAAPRIRQYLEYKLEEIMICCRIPVPMDLALNDDKHMAGRLIASINSQISLHNAANSLVLEPAQVQGLNTAVATISTNFIAHWSTGQTQAFAPGALLGVMQAIDNYADCFKFEPNPGDGRRYYHSLDRR